MLVVARKKNTGGRSEMTRSASSKRPASSSSLRPLRLRGRREIVMAMVDALNDILAEERTLY
jgi:hypothetical protein